MAAATDPSILRRAVEAEGGPNTFEGITAVKGVSDILIQDIYHWGFISTLICVTSMGRGTDYPKYISRSWPGR
jgi:hypothetical protein